MSVNGVTSVPGAAYTEYASSTTAKAEKEKQNTKEAETNVDTKTTKKDGVVYEHSAQTKKANAELVAKLKADTNTHTLQLQSIVEQLISKQGKAYGTANDMWKFLAEGNFTVDAATKSQAQADIAEDGYWGVKATSDRIIDFAKALANDDPAMIEKMKKAFQKGFDQATRAWGKKLPDISQQTYSTVMQKFDDWTAASQAKTAETEETEA